MSDTWHLKIQSLSLALALTLTARCPSLVFVEPAEHAGWLLAYVEPAGGEVLNSQNLWSQQIEVPCIIP